MSRYNGKFGRVQHTGVSMLKAGGHLTGAASPADFDQPGMEMPPKLKVAAETQREQPIYRGKGIVQRTPRFDLEGPA